MLQNNTFGPIQLDTFCCLIQLTSIAIGEKIKKIRKWTEAIRPPGRSSQIPHRLVKTSHYPRQSEPHIFPYPKTKESKLCCIV